MKIKLINSLITSKISAILWNQSAAHKSSLVSACAYRFRVVPPTFRPKTTFRMCPPGGAGERAGPAERLLARPLHPVVHRREELRDPHEPDAAGDARAPADGQPGPEEHLRPGEPPATHDHGGHERVTTVVAVCRLFSRQKNGNFLRIGLGWVLCCG